MAKPIGTIGAIPTLQVGGAVFTDLANLITLAVQISSSSNGTFRNAKTGATAGYAVTASTTLNIRALRALPNSTSAGTFVLLYGDTDLGFNSGSAFSNPVYYGGSSGMVAIVFPPNNAATPYAECTVNFNVPAAKYPGAINSSGGFLWAYGYES